MNTFILLSALPGSGKSTWARKYKETHSNVFIVESDEIRVRLTGKTQNFSQESKVWEVFLEDINNYGKGENVTVIADSTNLEDRFRAYYADQVIGFERKVLAYFDVPFEVCCKRNEQRKHGKVVPQSVMDRFKTEFTQPSIDVLGKYDSYWIIGSDFQVIEIK